MSLSKLESLPNEILIDIIEKYINGVDVLIALSYQLNGRFNSLISQCQRLHFNFIQCHKTDFRFCMGLLPAYIDKIEELAISEEDTPGQVFAFLNFFPSFEPFKRLRKLHFHINGEAVDSNINRTLLSLAHTSITTLSIKAIKMSNAYLMDTIINTIFHLKSLKRLSFMTDSDSIDWDLLLSTSSNIEYLTISGICFYFEQLPSICRCAPHLKYLDVQISNSTYLRHKAAKIRSEKNSIPTCELRTLLLSFQQSGQTTLDMLGEYFRSTPLLNRLEIKAHNKLINASAWESMLESSLPLLNCFSLQVTASDLRNFDVDNLLASFETSFWMAKKNFNIMITEHQESSSDPVPLHRLHLVEPYEFDLPVVKCQILPVRTVNGDVMIVNKLPSLKLSDICNTVSCHYYFENVKCLTVDNMNKTLLEWMTTYVNCSRITELTITGSSNETTALTLLLAWVINISSLHIKFDQLVGSNGAFMRKDNGLKWLDISSTKHTFSEEDIIFIAKSFPHLEHLQINTSDLYNIPVLKAYLPHLRSLNFKSLENVFRYYDDYTRKIWESELRQKTNFLFEHKDDSITVWIDQDAFEDGYWQTFIPQRSKAKGKSSASTASSSSATGTSSNDKKKKKGIFSFLKFPK